MKRLSVFFAFLALALNAPLVFAITLAFSPISQTVDFGVQATVEVWVTDLDTTSSPPNQAVGKYIVGAYDFNILYDPSILSFAGISFGTLLGGGPDNSIQDVDVDAVSNPASLNVAEVSVLSGSDLGSLQASLLEFVLFSLNFKAIREGTSLLSFSGNIAPEDDFLGDEEGNVIALAPTGTGSITVNPQAAPEPGTLSLMAAAAFAMAWRRRATSL
jgi:hypothetical protein